MAQRQNLIKFADARELKGIVNAQTKKNQTPNGYLKYSEIV